MPSYYVTVQRSDGKDINYLSPEGVVPNPYLFGDRGEAVKVMHRDFEASVHGNDKNVQEAREKGLNMKLHTVSDGVDQTIGSMCIEPVSQRTHPRGLSLSH